jgi:tRNA dimethylallyltransferase
MDTFSSIYERISRHIDSWGNQATIAIVGATGTGKSMLAEYLAEQIDCGILSADSMQVYRFMDIGTAKVSLEQRKVSYFGIDLVNPDEPYSAASYQHYARTVMQSEHDAGRIVLMCGGTGLYVRAALDEFTFSAGQQIDSALRTHYEQLAADRGADAFHALLAEKDPASAALIHPHNVRRVIRAFELLDSGSSYATQSAGMKQYPSHKETLLVGLMSSRENLYRHLDARVDQMMTAGLLDEVSWLVNHGYREALTSMQAIGYKEFFPVLDGFICIEEAIDAVKRATRHYAKRQETWFKRDDRIEWFDLRT